MRVRRRNLSRQAGMALVTVLWAIALLTIMAGSFSLSLQRDTNLVKFNDERARGVALADAAVHYAMLKVNASQMGGRPGSSASPDNLSPSHSTWRTDGFPCPIDLPTGKAVVQIFDESGKVNLNAIANEAGLPVLRTLLAQAFNGDQDRADRFADAIIDWVDQDQLTRLNGAEASDYEQAGKPYVPPDRGPQNGGFQALEELLMVLVDKNTGETLSPKIFQKLEPVLTVYTGSSVVNVTKASRKALETLPLQCMDKATAAQHWALRGDSCFELPPTQQQPPMLAPAATAQMPGQIGCMLGNSPATVYTIYASSRTPEGQVTTVKAVIARRQNPTNNGSPFTFLSWKQLPSALADRSESNQGNPGP